MLFSTEFDFTWGLRVRDVLILYPRYKCSPPLSLPRCKPSASSWWLIPMKLPGGEQSPHVCPESGKPTEKSEAEADKPIPFSSSILSSQCEDEPVPLCPQRCLSLPANRNTPSTHTASPQSPGSATARLPALTAFLPALAHASCTPQPEESA